MFTYKDKEYGSKAEVVREMYDQGKVSLSVADKKRVADELGMTVQTVHATIQKHLGLVRPSGNKPTKTDTVTPAVTQAHIRLKKKVAHIDVEPIFINDKKPEVKAELMKDPKKIAVTWAPNQWGLPVSVPPLYVIDPNYDPDWLPEPEDTIEKPWENDA